MKTLYFSATVNNLYIAKKLGGELLSIPQLIKNNEYEIEDDVVGIVFPVFYANSPNIVREFLKKANIKADYIFTIASYGSNGDQNALRLMKKALNDRGMKVKYSNSVLMIDNYLPMFDIEKEKEIKKDLDIDGSIENIRRDIESRKEFIFKKKHFTNVPFIEKILESTMTKRFHVQVDDGCINCKICTQVCPRGNIRIIEEKPVLGDNCEFCLACVHHCKKNVLNTNKEFNKERYINPNIKLSEIIESNSILD